MLNGITFDLLLISLYSLDKSKAKTLINTIWEIIE